MKRKVLRWIIRLISSKKRAPYLINMIATEYEINLLLHAYRNVGVHKANFEWSGEKTFLENILKIELRKVENPILFDVGANKGDYSKLLAENFNNASIHAFEPSLETYKDLKNNLRKYSSVQTNNIGLGPKKERIILYKPYTDSTSSHATLYKGVIDGLLHKEQIVEETIDINTIDKYCEEKKISNIHFLKIDTEGHELQVLRGAHKMIAEKKIDFIQFEFNEMNIISRTFLKDFYELLIGYNFFRLNTNNLIPLGNYSSFNEIFQFQNILAANSDINSTLIPR